MSDNEADREDEAQYVDDNAAHQACYIFTPYLNPDVGHDQPTKKRRKTKHSPEEQPSTFPLLSHGAEPAQLAKIRYDTFQKLWKRKQDRFNALIERVDEDFLGKIVQFVEAPHSSSAGRLRTGLLVSGPDGGAQMRLLEQYKNDQAENDLRKIVVQLRASHCINLQTALRSFIKGAISSQIGMNGYQAFLDKHKRLVPMNYDLELLQIFVSEHTIQRIVLSFLDVETLDIGILCELLATLGSWSETIPVIALLGIATTVDLFESRLPKSIVEVLDATTFKLQSSSDVFQQILDDIRTDPEQGVIFGPLTVLALEEMINDQGVTVHAFTCAIKYAIMSHFFANSLSVLLTGELSSLHQDESLCAAIRNTSSFQEYCEDLLRNGKSSKAAATAATKRISQLLTSDSELLELAFAAVKPSSKHSSPTQRTRSPTFSLEEAYTLNSRHLFNPFAPRPRYALERALSTPSDYLGCECCHSTPSSSLPSSAPPTTTLYTLLQEAGTVINVRDLFDAFCARCFPRSDADEDGIPDKADRLHLSTFYSSLAELRMLGLVKGSTSALVKKRALAAAGADDGSVFASTGRGRDRYGDVDFIAKTGWAGL